MNKIYKKINTLLGVTRWDVLHKLILYLLINDIFCIYIKNEVYWMFFRIMEFPMNNIFFSRIYYV